jgi:hypothetical protein
VFCQVGARVRTLFFPACRRFGGSFANCNLRFRTKPEPEVTVSSASSTVLAQREMEKQRSPLV